MQESIEGKLRRSIDHPGFAARLMDTVARIRTGSRSALARAHEVAAELQRPAVEARDKANLKHQELYQELQRERQALHNPIDQAEREKAQVRIHNIEQEFTRLTEEINQLTPRANIEVTKILEQETNAFDSLIVEMSGYLDDTSAMLRGLDATEKVREVVKADFATKTESFLEAAAFHRNQAGWMLFSMVVMALAVASGIYMLFIHSPIPPGPLSTGLPVRVPVDQVVLLVTGRMAFLFLAGWALKYVADLHRAHAEQAVIYRDRKAALGIAEAMLAASPGDDQQRELLKMLADGYLNFEQSAFRRHQRHEPKELEFDVQLKRLKDAVDAVRPLLEPVAKAAEKAK
ncbi:hypothetical protein [Corallococcus sp. CA053C]|uniref:hypothetical protein n=1 Tax=Corallococcus sp. CA053C TaxID=2316732 RepID=UPI0011C44690|nr:hypothetical protein [Corallococcus sp. CA053C]